jgi:16S rRNA (guanine966-N2)-methyltransferase
MRITGGRLRGRILLAPKSRRIRPTADRVREAIFNILGQDLTGYQVLDLFSGTGSLGLEALSRGAAYAVFIDCLDESIDLINRNIARCGHQDASRILARDLTRGIPWGHVALKNRFDLVFLDPPYASDVVPATMADIAAGKRLSNAARVFIETGKKTELPVSVSGFFSSFSRVYGDTKITVYTYGGLTLS